MRMRSRAGFVTGILITASFAVVTAAQQGPPAPAAEMAQLAYMEGSWACEGKMFETPVSPAGAMTTTADIRKDLNGHFQSGTIKGSAPNMPPFEGRFHVTYDTGAKRFVMLWVDNMGGWSQSSSAGWKGETMVYEGDSHMGGQTMRSRDTFTKAAGGGMKHTWDMQVKGKWIPAGEETCTKK